jgi:hypothetical protein
MTISTGSHWLDLFIEVVLIKYLILHGVADIIRRFIRFFWQRVVLTRLLRTRADIQLYIYWRNNVIKNRQATSKGNVHGRIVVVLACIVLVALGYSTLGNLL